MELNKTQVEALKALLGSNQVEVSEKAFNEFYSKELKEIEELQEQLEEAYVNALDSIKWISTREDLESSDLDYDIGTIKDLNKQLRVLRHKIDTGRSLIEALGMEIK
jgi:hypothetical protein